MKSRNIFFAGLGAAALAVAAYCPKPATTGNKEAVLMQTLIGGLEQLHFSPPTIDDEFSKKVYKTYLNHLDFGRRFLIQSDVDKLKAYETKLDDQIHAGSTEFFDLSLTILDEGMTKAEAFYKDAIAQPMDFTKKEEVELDGDKKPYAKNDAELKDMWRRMIKYEVMTRLANKLEIKEKAKTDPKSDVKSDSKEQVNSDAKSETKTEIKDKSETELQADALKEATKNYNDYFKRIKKIKRSDRFGIFLNAITAVYDPHTEYFAPIEKQNFDLGMSGRLIGIGARLQSDPDGDFTKVSDIITGGPAWKQKDLVEGDLIMKVAQGDKDPVDVAGMDINDVVSMIR